MRQRARQLLVFFGFLVLSQNIACAYETLDVDFNGRKQTVRYELYVPPEIKRGQRVPVLICTGGLPVYDGVYAHSNTQECMSDVWKEFADQNRLAILGLGFLFIETDWPNKESYQYVQAWSANALNTILKKIGRQFRVDANKIFMYGVSAGAQFSVRFAQMEPRRVIAVAAHAAGGFDEPKEFIPVKFLLTVGDLDSIETPRLELARAFTELSRQKNIDITLEVIRGLGHRQTFEQDEASRAFIRKYLEQFMDR